MLKWLLILNCFLLRKRRFNHTSSHENEETRVTSLWLEWQVGMLRSRSRQHGGGHIFLDS